MLLDLLGDTRFDDVDIRLPHYFDRTVESAARERHWRRVKGGWDGPWPVFRASGALHGVAQEQGSGDRGALREETSSSSGQESSEEETVSPSPALGSSDEEDPELELKEDYITSRPLRLPRLSSSPSSPGPAPQVLADDAEQDAAGNVVNPVPSHASATHSSGTNSDKEEEEEEMYEEGEVENGWAASDEGSSAPSSEEAQQGRSERKSRWMRWGVERILRRWRRISDCSGSVA